MSKGEHGSQGSVMSRVSQGCSKPLSSQSCILLPFGTRHSCLPYKLVKRCIVISKPLHPIHDQLSTSLSLNRIIITLNSSTTVYGCVFHLESTDTNGPKTINSLTPQLLAEIFRLSTSYQRPEETADTERLKVTPPVTQQSHRSPWVFCLVNQGWKQIATENRSLWSYIRISKNDIISPSLLELQLTRSGTCPLTVEFDGPLNGLTAQVRTICNHAGRWNHVTIFPKAGTLDMLNRHAPFKFPLMEHLEVVYETHTQVVIPTRLYTAPRLRKLSLSLFRDFLHSLPAALDVEEVRLHTTEASLPSLLQFFPLIAPTVVTLYMKTHTSNGHNNEALIPTFPPTVFPRLRAFYLKGYGRRFSALIKGGMILPAIEEITVSSGDSTTYLAVARLLNESNPLLRSLSIVMPRAGCSYNDPDKCLESRALPFSLKGLQILFSTAPPGLQLDLRGCPHSIHGIIREVDLPRGVQGLRLRYRKEGNWPAAGRTFRAVPQSVRPTPVIPEDIIRKLQTGALLVTATCLPHITIDHLKPSERAALVETLGDGFVVSSDEASDSISPWNDYHFYNSYAWHGRWIRWP
ncbi:hypothetical protein HGRIS_007161 [Hohenbuehelia grisea]|uniref:F-box domain-containing protein n=1 Tax=Hohenbuehelia grisea TaxID=104357 RepID=A0ABR3JB79_9AGAR